MGSTTLTRRFCLCSLIVVATIAFSGCSRRHSFNGTWTKRAGSSDLPDVVTLKQSNDWFKMRYWAEGGGVETVALRLDGREHVWSKSNGFETTYRAQLNESTLSLTKHVTGQIPGSKTLTDFTCNEQWSLMDGELRVTSEGKDTVFERAPLTRALFVGGP